MRGSWNAVQILVGALVLFGLGALNGRPSTFPDTADYYSQGEYFASRLHLTPGKSSPSRDDDPTSVMPNARNASDKLSLTIAGGRSPYYGLFLFLTDQLGSLWLTAAIQSIAASWIVWLLARVSLPDRFPTAFYALIGVTTLGTSLPFLAAFAMPDVFGGVGLACVVLILFHGRGLTRGTLAAIWTMLTASLAFHTSNAALTITLIPIGAAMLVVLRQDKRAIVKAMSLIIGSLVIATGLDAAFKLAYRLDTGQAQTTPPFLIARILADGPGRDYLRSKCPGGASPTLCRFKDRPLDKEEDILWSGNSKTGVFFVSDYATRHQLKIEEQDFVLAVLTFEPWGQMTASTKNWLKQLGLFTINDTLRNRSDFLAAPYWRRTAAALIVPNIAECVEDRAKCEQRFAAEPLFIIHYIVVILSLRNMVGHLIRMKRENAATTMPSEVDATRRLLMGAAVFIVLAVIANAAVCGILVGPFQRYSARIIWLIPVSAVLVEFAARASKARNVAGQISVAVPADISRRMEPTDFTMARWDRPPS